MLTICTTISLGNFGRMKMSHLMADTTEELLTMVDKIGVHINGKAGV